MKSLRTFSPFNTLKRKGLFIVLFLGLSSVEGHGMVADPERMETEEMRRHISPGMVGAPIPVTEQFRHMRPEQGRKGKSGSTTKKRNEEGKCPPRVSSSSSTSNQRVSEIPPHAAVSSEKTTEELREDTQAQESPAPQIQPIYLSGSNRHELAIDLPPLPPFPDLKSLPLLEPREGKELTTSLHSIDDWKERLRKLEEEVVAPLIARTPSTGFTLNISTLEGLFREPSTALDLSLLPPFSEAEWAPKPRELLEYAHDHSFPSILLQEEASHMPSTPAQIFPLLSVRAFDELSLYLGNKFEPVNKFLRVFGVKERETSDSIEVGMEILFGKNEATRATYILPIALFLPPNMILEEEEHWSILERWVGEEWGRNIQGIRRFSALFQSSSSKTERDAYLKSFITPEILEEMQVLPLTCQESPSPVESTRPDIGFRPIYGPLSVIGASRFPLSLKERELPERLPDILRWGWDFWEEKEEYPEISFCPDGAQELQTFLFLPGASEKLFHLLIQNRSGLELEIPRLLPRVTIDGATVPFLAMMRREKEGGRFPLLPLGAFLPVPLRPDARLPAKLDHGLMTLRLLSEGETSVVSVPLLPVLPEEEVEPSPQPVSVWDMSMSLLKVGLEKSQTLLLRGVRKSTIVLREVAEHLMTSSSITLEESYLPPEEDASEMSEVEKNQAIFRRVAQELASDDLLFSREEVGELKVLSFESINRFSWGLESSFITLPHDQVLSKIEDRSLFYESWAALENGAQLYIQIATGEGHDALSPPLTVLPLIEKGAFQILSEMKLLDLHPERLTIKKRTNTRLYGSHLGGADVPLIIALEKGAHAMSLQEIPDLNNGVERLRRLNHHARTLFLEKRCLLGNPPVWPVLNLQEVGTLKIRGWSSALPVARECDQIHVTSPYQMVAGTFVNLPIFKKAPTTPTYMMSLWRQGDSNPFLMRPLISPDVFERLVEANLVEGFDKFKNHGRQDHACFGQCIGSGFFVAMKICGIHIPVVSFEKAASDFDQILSLPGVSEGLARAHFLSHPDMTDIILRFVK